MSSTLARSTRPSGDPGPLPTRQQLDELDALLQRMLDLPVHQAEEPAAAEAPARPRLYEPRQAPPSYVAVETAAPADDAGLGPRLVEPPPPAALPEEDPRAELARLEETLPPRPDDWVPLRSAWQPSAQTWKPLAESWHQSTAPPGAMPDPPITVPPSAPALLPPAAAEPAAAVTLPAAAAAPEPPPTPLLLWPAVAFNRVFDACLLPLGPLAGWLRGRAGRNLLGTVGLLCLCAAAALLVADGIGWSW